jgi:hypothetical protein
MHDNNSKFGTLVLVQTKNLNMCMDLKLCIQIGRTYLELYLKEPFNLFGCCGVREKKNADFYYIQNKENVFLFNKLTIKTENDIQYFNKYQLKRKEEKNQRKIDNLITENNLIDGDKDNNIGNKNSNANNDNKNEGNEVKEPKENNNNENSFDDIEKLIYDENEQENNNDNNNDNNNENNNENNNDVNELEAQKDIDKNEDNINVNENNENVNNSNDINHQLNLSELNNIYT